MKTRKTTKRFVTLLVALCLALSVLSAAAFADFNMDNPMHAGDTMPDFSTTMTDGSTFTLSEALKNHKAVMINFWATWCSACVGEMPAMQQAYESYTGDIALVCISCSDTNEEISSFMKEQGLNLPTAQDDAGISFNASHGAFPTTIIVDRFGRIAYYSQGAIEKPEDYIRIWDTYTADDYTETQLYSFEII